MDHVIYKGEKFKVSIIYQYSGLEKISLKHLELRKRGINSISEIEGLSQLKELQSLDLWGNNITEVKGLEELSKLERLNLGANQISEIKGIEGLIWLTHLSLGDKISEIKGLEKLINLTHLTLGRNISEIKNLANLKNLRILDLSKNQISEIKGLELLTNIVNLDLSSNQISEIKGLSSLRKLSSLELSSNQISEIKELNTLKNLSSLDLSYNKIDEIKGLEGLKKICNLNLSENKITEIKGIDSLPSLQDLDLAHNQITSVKGIENLPECVIHLYSNPIPKVEMERFRGYVNGGFVVHIQLYENQIITIFNNSHKKINDNSYMFSIYCRNIDGKLPNPNFELHLHLINPKGRALQPFRMNLDPSDLQHPDYNLKKAVKFHTSIDLNRLYEEEGLWHYFFTLKDETNKDKLIYLPENGYLRGPETSSPGNAVCIGHSVSSIPCKRYNCAGFMKDDYEFIVNFFYSKELKDVYLCLIPAQKTDGIDISNTVGIKKFNMTLVKPESTFEVIFRCIINFENLGYADTELGWFYHYYEVILKDGTKGYYGQPRGFYTKHEDSEFSEKEIWEDINGPFVARNHPQLVDYLFEDSKHSIYSPSFFLGEIEELLKNVPKTEYQVKSDYNLRFEVLYSDSKGYKPFNGYPRLIFRNKELDKKFEYIMFPNNVISFLTQHYGEVCDSYICDVNWAHIPKGIWHFHFEAKNSKGNLIKNLLGKEKFLRI